MSPITLPINIRQAYTLQNVVLKVRLVKGLDIVIVVSNAHRTTDITGTVAVANLL